MLRGIVPNRRQDGWGEEFEITFRNRKDTETGVRVTEHRSTPACYRCHAIRWCVLVSPVNRKPRRV